jgi:hypothetical protein
MECRYLRIGGYVKFTAVLSTNAGAMFDFSARRCGTSLRPEAVILKQLCQRALTTSAPIARLPNRAAANSQIFSLWKGH